MYPSRPTRLTGFYLVILLMTIAILLPWTAMPAQAQSKMVFAHYMVTNQDYQADDPNDTPPEVLKIAAYEKEITQAQAAGIDGWALNCGGWSTQTYYITYATEIFEAAVDLNSGFKLFFSADFAPGLNQEGDVLDMMRRFCNNPTYAPVCLKYNNAYVLSSFSGDQTAYGPTFWSQLRTDLTNGTDPSGTISGFPAVSSAPLSVLFLPAFFLGGTNPALSELATDWVPFENIVDGLFYWGVQGVAGSGLPQNDQLPCMNYESQVAHGSGKLFMAPVVFQFWSPNNASGNEYYEASGYHQMRLMWNNIINSSHPDLVEEPTWNDFIEGSYISPIDDPNKYPNANFLGENGVPTTQLGYYHSHIGAWALTPYYVQWYETGVQPTITADSIYWAYRTQSKSFSGGGGPVTGTVNGPEADDVYVTVNAAAPAVLKVTLGGTVTTVNVPQGSNDFAVPFNTTNVTPTFELDRSGSPVIAAVNGTDEIMTSPPYNDCYYSTGYANASALSQAPTQPVNVTAAGASGQVDLSWSPSTGTSNITYSVYRGTSAGGEGASAIASGITAGWYTPTINYADTSAANGTKYYYIVKGVNSLGASSGSTEVSATAGAPAVPSTPASLSASGFDDDVFLGWSASATGQGPITYNVYRGTSSGGESSTPVASGLGSAGYVDTGLTDGTTYYYKVAAVNAGGTSAMSSEMSTKTSTPVVRIAAGSSSAVGNYSADEDFSGGTAFSVSLPITTTNAIDPAPVNVYEGGRYGAMTYTIPGLTAGQTYIVRLHFCESSWFLVGSRLFNVAINGTTYLPNFDIFATGGQLVPVIENIPVAANSSGQIAITFTLGAEDNPVISGIEVLNGGTVPTLPAVPTPSAAANNGQAIISWPAIPGATSYNVYRNTTSGAETTFPFATTSASSSSTFTDNFLANGTTYYYKVAAVDPVGTSALSSEVSATPAATATPPTSPTGLTATGGNAQVALAWSASSGSGTITYNVFRGTSSGAETLLVSGVNSPSYTDNTAANGTTYYYYVTATNSVGTSGQSNEASAKPVAPTLGSVPTLSATASDASIALSWTTSTGTSPITYNLYRSTTSGGEGTTPYKSGLITTSFTDTGLASGTTYYYTVASVNPAGTSAQSGEASAKTLTAVYQIDCGSGSAVSPYVADEFFSAGNEFSSAATINTSGVTNPAPAAVYQTVRWLASFNYTIPNLTAGSSYLVRLHFCELSFTAAGSREFNVAINGSSVLSNFDIFATAGGQNVAVEKDFTATANSSGQIVIAFSAGAADNPEIAGIEIYGGAGQSQNPPPAPTGLSAAAGNSTVSLSWTGSSGATSYNVYRGTSSGGESGTPIATGLTGTSYTDSSVTNGSTYFYKVAAVNAAGTSGQSNEASATPEPSIPPAPATLLATPGNATVTLNWTASSGATSYSVFRGTSSGGEGSTAIGTSTGTSYTDSSVTNGTTYFYTVKAVNTAGTSGSSIEASATPSAGAPPAPTNLAATGGNATVSLTWSTSSGATSYSVFRGTSSGGEGSTAIGTSTGASYTDNSVTNGTKYYYTVKAVSSGGTSGASNEASATPTGGTTAVYQIDCGGGAVAPFVADEFFSAGNEFSSSATINTSGVTNPAPAAVYQTVRWNSSFNYTIPGLTAGQSYTVRLHFCELTWTAAGQRVFNVAINGNSYLSNFDIFATAGGQNKALVEQTTATANSSGQIVISLTQGSADNPEIAGIEIDGSGGGGTAPPAPTGLSATGGNASVSLTWSASSGATSYSVYRGTSSGGEGSTAIGTSTGTSYTDSSVTNGTKYYYTVKAVNSAGASGASNEASATPTAGVPPAPTNLAATGGNATVSLTWSSSSGATSYGVYRGTSSGGEGSTAIGTSTGTSYTDSSVTNGTTYYYTVKAVSSGGTSGASNEAHATPSAGLTAVYQIDCGSPSAVSPFVADEFFNTGNEFSSSATINTSGVTNAAPAAVYQSVRWNSAFAYTIPNLTAGSTYTVRLHFCELTWTAAGQRLFNVAINGNSYLSSFDVFATAGGQNKALVEQTTATANSSGQIVISFTQGSVDNPEIAGIEVLH